MLLLWVKLDGKEDLEIIMIKHEYGIDIFIISAI